MCKPASLGGVPVLITGAGGFLGRHIVSAIASAGARVRAVLGPPASKLAVPIGVEDWLEADVRNAVSIENAVAGAEQVIHLAGPPSVAWSFDATSEYIQTHVEGTAVVVKAAQAAGVRRLIYVSSAEVYGRPSCEYVPEEHTLHARSPYAACKIAAEQLIHSFAAAYGLDAVILRPFSVFGKGASPDSILPCIVRSVRKREPVVVRDCRPVRDFCWSTDLSQAVLCAALLPSTPCVRTFNVGTMAGTSVRELINLAFSLAGIELPVLVTGSSRPGNSDILHLVADNRRAQHELGWNPHVTLSEGMLQLLQEPG